MCQLILGQGALQYMGWFGLQPCEQLPPHRRQPAWHPSFLLKGFQAPDAVEVQVWENRAVGTPKKTQHVE